MFEREDDAGANLELVSRSSSSFANRLGSVDGLVTFSPINIAANFSTTGLMARVDFNGSPPAAPARGAASADAGADGGWAGGARWDPIEWVPGGAPPRPRGRRGAFQLGYRK